MTDCEDPVRYTFHDPVKDPPPDALWSLAQAVDFMKERTGHQWAQEIRMSVAGRDKLRAAIARQPPYPPSPIDQPLPVSINGIPLVLDRGQLNEFEIVWSDAPTFQPNGCGAKGGWFRPPQWHSEATCDAHDVAYDIGGTEQDRRRADRELLNGMKRDASTRPWWQRPWYALQAWTYYRAVRWCGRPHFRYRSTP